MQLHPAFEDRLLGWRIVQADDLFREEYVRAKLPTSGGNVVLGPGERDEDEKYDERRASRSVEAIRSFIKAFKAWAPGERWVVATDSGVPFEFKGNALTSELEIKGAPYHFFWKPNYDDTTVVPYSKKLDFDLLSDTNPVTFRAIIRVARFAAFFRHCKQSARGWGELVKGVSQSADAYEAKTPDFALAGD